MAFNPDEYLAQPPASGAIALPPVTVTPGEEPQTQVAAAGGFDPDAYLRSTAPRAPIAPPAAFDPDVYLGIKKPAPAAQTETPSPGIAGYGLETAKQFGLGAVGNIASAIRGLAPASEENRRLEAAITAIQSGKDIQEAVQEPPVPPRPLTEEPMYQAGDIVEKKAKEWLQPSGSLHPFVEKVARGFGSVGGNIVTSLIPGGGALIPIQGIGEAAQTAVEKGATPEQQERAARLGTLPGMTDFVDILLPNIGGKALASIPKWAVRLFEGAFVEAGQEGIQQLWQNMITRGVYKPDQNIWEDVGESALIGGIVGGGTSLALGGHKPTPGTTPTEEQLARAGTGVAEVAPTQGPPGPPSAPPPAAPPGWATTGGTPTTTQATGLLNALLGGNVGHLTAPTDTPMDVADVATGAIAPTRLGFTEPTALTGAVAPTATPADVPTNAALPMSPMRMTLLEHQANGPPGATQRTARATLEQELQNAVARNEIPAAPPSPDPQVIRGNEVSTLLSPDTIPNGPLDLRPGTAIVPEPQTVQPFGTVAKSGAFTTPGGVIPGRPGTARLPGWGAIPTLHSTTLSALLPNIQSDYAANKPMTKVLAQVLAQTLMRLIPNMPVHIVRNADMPTAWGRYYPSRSIAAGGPILINENALKNRDSFVHTLLHESVHAVTSNLMKFDPLIAARVRKIMDIAKQHHTKIARNEDLPYGLSTNEREFVAEAFTNPEFQEFLHGIKAPRALLQELGLEAKPTLWEAFRDMVRKIVGLPDTYQAKSLLETAMRASTDVIDAQARHIENTQKLFNGIEPDLKAVERQPESKGIYDMLGGLADHMPTPGTSAAMKVQAGYADKMNKFYKYMVHAFQLGELNPKLVALQRYLEKMRFAAVEESGINDAALKVMKDWNNIGRAQAEGLTQFIDDITNMVYRTAAEIKRGISRKPTPTEFNTLARKYKLNTAALDVFSKINTMFDQFLDQTSQLARDEAMQITDPVARGNALNAINANVASLKSRPYFPFMRYGRHVVLIRNAAGRVVFREHFERRGLRSAESFQKEALARLEKDMANLQRLYGAGVKVEADILSESSLPMVGMSGMMLDLMAQKLRLTPLQQHALEQLRLELSPAQSFQHRFQHKSYVKGYSQDFQRSFAQYFFHGAKWYVKTKYASAMREDIANVKAGAMGSLTPIKRLQLHQFLEDHLENNFLNPAQDFITFKAGLVFWTLAYVPVSAAVNMSQVPMVSLPYLGSKFGDVRASLALSRAIGTARNYYRRGTVAGITSDEARALNYAMQTGRLEQTLGVELASWAQGGNLGVGYGGSAVQRTIHSAVEKGMWTFSIAEKWNRRVTFSAAYNLAKSQPNSAYVREALGRYTHELGNMVKSGFSQHEAEAILVASHVVDQTQFMASQESRPRVMRGKLGTLFLYKRFMQGLMFLTLNNKKDFAPRFAIMALALGGLGGLPGYDDLKEIARLLGWWMYGKDFSLDREIRRLIVGMTDEKWAPDQVLHGFARTGFGVPWLLNMMGNAVGQSPTVNQQTGAPQGPDLSRSIGPGAILPVEMGKLFGPPVNDPAKMFGEQSARAGGVMGGLAFNFYRALMSKDSPGDFKRWELMMPRFAKNLSSAYRAYSEEKTRGKNDTAIVRFDTRDPEHLGEMVGMGAGFQPRRLTAKWEELRDQGEQIKFIETEKGMILEQWAAAIRGGRDAAEMERMRTATVEFNNNLPEWARGEKLSSDTINKSVRMKLETQQLQEAGLAKQKGRIPIIQEIQRLHPEAVIDVRKVQ